jgi:hypothetical protein
MAMKHVTHRRQRDLPCDLRWAHAHRVFFRPFRLPGWVGWRWVRGILFQVHFKQMGSLSVWFFCVTLQICAAFWDSFRHIIKAWRRSWHVTVLCTGTPHIL